ncbi:hypothetical protein RchiOBHm_Chr3g0451861 [Rosa chinensis]|uniref:Uncharacterized protein n=1 Tax=Rosa chinensis TaxID=74649 RepID=A0A2P6R660_ROSCH|nr:hypothetical protein RchiOBHm_Chr3g0451861 [Rosa chinensis]
MPLNMNAKLSYPNPEMAVLETIGTLERYLLVTQIEGIRQIVCGHPLGPHQVAPIPDITLSSSSHNNQIISQARMAINSETKLFDCSFTKGQIFSALHFHGSGTQEWSILYLEVELCYNGVFVSSG